MLIDSVPWTRSIVFFVLFFIKKKSTFVTSPLFEKERKEKREKREKADLSPGPATGGAFARVPSPEPSRHQLSCRFSLGFVSSSSRLA